jgi:metallophosphoesterase (TIGR00282 family)
MATVKAVMIGDVMGEPGLDALESFLPSLKKEVDFIVVNGENAADGFGLTEADFRRIIAAGADVVTSGNHIWEKREFLPVLETEERVLRPANYPAGTPGSGWFQTEKDGKTWIVINLQGRELLSAIDCPFRCLDNLLSTLAGRVTDTHPLAKEDNSFQGSYPIILIDFHAESSREKEAMGFYADGRTSLIAGTHTHVQTADERILPKGSAYISDLGMTGITNSVIGMDPKICQDRVRKQVLYRMEIAGKSPETPEANRAELQGVIAEIESTTGKAVSIKRLRLA